MDEAAERIRINYPGDPNSSQVEISVRSQGVMAGGSYDVFRGLRVEHVASDSVAAMYLGPNQRVEDCRLEYNNLDGVYAGTGLVFLRSTSNHNGMLGIALNGDNSLLESSETSYNSWRYGPWFNAGGIKVVGNTPPTGHQIRHHTAKYNNGAGVWFDTVGSGNVVEASLFEGNLIHSIDFEAAAGPNWIVNNILAGTTKTNGNIPPVLDGAAISLSSASYTHILNNTIVDSDGPGICIGGYLRDGYYSHDTRFFNNIIVNSGITAVFVGGGPPSYLREDPIVGSHDFDNNLYYDNPITITFPKLGTLYENEYWSLSEWQQNRGEDLHSLDAPPMFTNPASRDYSLQTGSPAIDAGRDLPDVTEDFLGASRRDGIRTDIGALELPVSRISPTPTPTVCPPKPVNPWSR